MFYLPGMLKSLDGFWLSRAVRSRLEALKSRGRLDLIDAHFGYPDGVGCVRVACDLGIPVFVTIRGVEEDYLGIPAIRAHLTASWRRATGLICVSHSLRETVISEGIDPGIVRVVHNAVNRERFRPRDRSRARKDLGIEDEVRLIVSVGNLLSVKRHDVLIRAAAGLKSGGYNVHLVIIGGKMHESMYPTELRKLAEELGLAGNVTFTGRLAPDEIARWLNAANVFALASRREGCCNAVLEALASGVPVVATAVGDNRWFVKDGDNGYTVPAGDPEALEAVLFEALYRTDWDAAHIAGSLKVGDWDGVAREVVDFFRERLAGNSRERAGSPIAGRATGLHSG